MFIKPIGVILAVLVVIYSNIFVIKLTTSHQSKVKVIAPYYSPDAFKVPENIKKKRKIPLISIKLPIIMYHYVEYVADANDIVKKKLAMSPYYFDLQMKAFKDAGYETYFVKDVPKILSGDLKVGSRSAVLTFDDGYRDFYSIVLPILKKYNLKASLYIIVDYIGWKDFLSKEEIQHIIDSKLVEIGSHTLDHVYLKNMKKEIAMHQITESKKQLEEMFHIPVETFAYPFGAFTEESIELV
ncbi:MAG: polysaccharide deacetylase family protein, partial [Patescibacteria group bacterium]